MNVRPAAGNNLIRPWRSTIDPAAECCDLVCRQWRPLGRHSRVRMQPCDIAIKKTVQAFSRNDRCPVVSTGYGSLFDIEPQAALLLLGSMALVTSIGKNGPDITRELDVR